jgi:hypothetical protein
MLIFCYDRLCVGQNTFPFVWSVALEEQSLQVIENKMPRKIDVLKWD